MSGGAKSHNKGHVRWLVQPASGNYTVRGGKRQPWKVKKNSSISHDWSLMCEKKPTAALTPVSWDMEPRTVIIYCSSSSREVCLTWGWCKTCLIFRPLALSDLVFSNTAMSPDLRNQLGENNVINNKDINREWTEWIFLFLLITSLEVEHTERSDKWNQDFISAYRKSSLPLAQLMRRWIVQQLTLLPHKSLNENWTKHPQF